MGEELVKPQWNGFSLIYSKYELFGIPGFLGIISPTRVDYKKNIPIISNFSKTITNTTNQNSIVKINY